MINTEPILNLLRTNSVTRYLVFQASNPFVSNLRELLNELGFGQELDWRRLGANEVFGQETVAALRAFATRNRLDADGLALTPFQAILLLDRYEVVEGIRLLYRSTNARTLSTDFNFYDVNNFGVLQLARILDILNIKGQTVSDTLREYARRKGLSSDGRQLSEPLARALLSDISQLYGPELLPANNSNSGNTPVSPPSYPQPQQPVNRDLNITDQGANVIVTDGAKQVVFRKMPPAGVATSGFNQVTPFVEQNQDLLMDLDLTPTSLQVMEAVSKNEGRLDGINTYDKGFLSFGIFQWTLGTDDRAGELPALLLEIKSTFPSAFRTFFANFGIDVADNTNTTYGYLTYNGQPVNSVYLKEQFRHPSWAFRFWRAGQDPNVQAIQVKHALNRLRNFYWKDNFAVFSFTLNRVITSAYGVALLLDHHVNRPSWVKPTVELAMSQTGLTNPSVWTDQDEMRLLEAYLNIRETYTDNRSSPMTKSRARAQMIFQEVQAGRLSTNRGSFQASNMAVRSYDLRSQFDTSVLPPVQYAQRDYPDIENERE